MKRNKYLLILYAFLIQCFYLILIYHGAEDRIYIVLLYYRYIGYENIVFIFSFMLTFFLFLPTFLLYILLKKNYYIFIVLYFVLSISFIIFKNFYVYYFVYDDFRKNQFTYIKNEQNIWNTEYITNDDIVNEYLVKKQVQFKTDTSGIYIESDIYEKVDGLFSKFNWRYPSFNSLLPYSNNPLSTSEYRFQMDSEYFIILSSTYKNDKWPELCYSYFRKDKYFKYKFSRDTLFFDTNPDTCRYRRQPEFEQKNMPYFRELESGFPWHLFVFWK